MLKLIEYLYIVVFVIVTVILSHRNAIHTDRTLVYAHFGRFGYLAMPYFYTDL